jgi:hypothetical protein
MKAELKRLHSPDVDIRSYNPDSNESFCVLVQALYGPVGIDAEESFDFVICNPIWLKNECSRNQIISGRSLIIVQFFRYREIELYLRSLVESLNEPNWSDIAIKLNRHGLWEFEDYRS